MSDLVVIRQLRVDTLIGVYAWERKVRQTLVLDLDMAWDNRAPAATDAVADALDYDAVCQRIRAFAADSEFQLIEALAEALAALLMGEFAVPWLRLRVGKPGAVAGTHDVAVVIERGEQP